MLNKENYEIKDFIGKGAYGYVNLFIDKITGKEVAIKMINLSSNNNLKALQNEINITKNLNHPNIIKYFGYFTNNLQSEINIVMEYAYNGDLEKILEKRIEHFKEEEILHFFVQICKGVKILHQNKIIHRDLKPANILVFGKNLKIGDFGISRILLNGEKAETNIGTPNYLSPEIIQGKKYSFESDIWNLGLILYELITLKKAFKIQKNMINLYRNIINTYYPPVSSNLYKSELVEIISKCLNKERRKRPTIDEILDNPIIKNFMDENDLDDKKKVKEIQIEEIAKSDKNENDTKFNSKESLFIRNNEYKKIAKSDKNENDSKFNWKESLFIRNN